MIPRPSKDVKDLIAALTPGHTIFAHTETVEAVQIRLRHTTHIGATPQLGNPQTHAQQPAAAPADIVAAIKAALPKIEPAAQNPELKLRDARIAELESELVLLKSIEADQERLLQRQALEMDKLNERVAILSLIRVEVVTAPAGQRQKSAAPPSPALSPQGEVLRQHTLIAHTPDPQFTERRNQRQREKLNSLASKLRNLPSAEKAAALFLWQNESESYTLADIAVRMGYAPISMTSNPPTTICDLGIVQRFKTDLPHKPYHYRYSRQICDQYPDIPPPFIRETILKALS
jgi:hypothetical protein